MNGEKTKYKIYHTHVQTTDEFNKIYTELKHIINQYGFASAADYLGISGLLSNYTDTQYGWDSSLTIHDIDISEDSETGELIIKMPPATHLTKLNIATEDNLTAIHPGHYHTENGMEAWDVIEAFTFDLQGGEAFDIGNAIKYICRWKHKNGVQDLEKAIVYLQHAIDRVKKLEKGND